MALREQDHRVMTIGAILLDGRRHAVVVLDGRADSGCDSALVESLRAGGRSHTVVDLRQVVGMSPELVKALLAALGVALDHRRTMRLVVRDHRQQQLIKGAGLGAMMPVHLSISDAMNAVDDAVRDAQRAVTPGRP